MQQWPSCAHPPPCMQPTSMKKKQKHMSNKGVLTEVYLTAKAPDPRYFQLNQSYYVPPLLPVVSGLPYPKKVGDMFKNTVRCHEISTDTAVLKGLGSFPFKDRNATRW